MNFRDSKSMIESSRLFPVLKKMPKGALLHTHGIGSLSSLIANATYRSDCFMNVGNATTDFGTGFFMYNASGTPPNSNGSNWQLVNTLRKQAGNATAFDKQLEESMMFYAPHHVDETAYWIEFDELIDRYESLAGYLPIYKQFFISGLEQCLQDNIQHIEMRGIGSYFFANYSFATAIQSMDLHLSVLQDFNIAHNSNLTMKWIVVDGRTAPHKSALEVMMEAVQLVQIYPEYVVGFDLVNEEDRFHTLLYYLDDFMKIENFTNSHQLPPLRYFFHAGETLWNSVFTAMNLFDAVLLNTTRIGHALALHDFPLLMQLVKQRGIGLELCPISNSMLEFFKDIRTHPGVTYAALGLPITLSNDDPILYGNHGLAYDFWEAYYSWGFTLSSLKKLALNSLQYSALFPAEKNDALQQFNVLWNDWVVNSLKQLA